MIARILFLLLFLCAPLAASPWDRDRPGDNFLPSVADACAGRVDELPPAYYDARIERLEGLLKQDALATKESLMLVDDLAVALLRRGQYDRAILWLDRKNAPTDALRDSNPRDANFHADRTHKNKAMCLVARWRADGHVADLDDALDLLRRAESESRHLPENWFLVREAEYLRQRPEHRGSVLPNVLGVTEETFRGARSAGSLQRVKLHGAIEQLVRRVTYGGERANPDLFYALSLACAIEGREMDSWLAALRAMELVEADTRLHCRHNLGPSALRETMTAHLTGKREQEFKGQLSGLRDAANAWKVRRQQYVTAQLALKLHPDTHPEFWSGWRDDEPAVTMTTPTGPTVPPEPIVGTAMFIGGGAMILFLFLVVGGLAIYFARRHPPGPNVDEL